MADTEHIDDLTMLNEATQRRWFHEECERLETKLRTSFTRTMWALFGVGAVLLVAAAVVLWTLTLKPVADIRADIALQKRAAHTTHEQVKALEREAAKRDDFESLSKKLQELQGKQDSSDRMADRLANEVKKALAEFKEAQNSLLNMVAGLSTRVSQEAEARDRMTQELGKVAGAMEKLGVRLDDRK